MKVQPSDSSATSLGYYVAVSAKGQIVLPKEIRKKLRVQPREKVYIRLEKGVLTVQPVQATLSSIYQSVPPVPVPPGETRLDAERRAKEAYIAQKWQRDNT
jgi:AbrB family looped-hinge helix DNA binding protein